MTHREGYLPSYLGQPLPPLTVSREVLLIALYCRLTEQQYTRMKHYLGVQYKFMVRVAVKP